MSQSAISMAETTAPHGFVPPIRRMRIMQRSTSVGSAPISSGRYTPRVEAT